MGINTKSLIMKDFIENIIVIDRRKLPNNIILIIDELFGDNALNAYQCLHLCDEDNGSNIEIVTKWFRTQEIINDRVLIDNTW